MATGYLTVDATQTIVWFMRDVVRLLRLITLIRLGNLLPLGFIIWWNGIPEGRFWLIPLMLLPIAFAWMPGLSRRMPRARFLAVAIFLLLTSQSVELVVTMRPSLWETLVTRIGQENWQLLLAWRNELYFYMIPPVVLAAWAFEYRGVLWGGLWVLFTHLLGGAWLLFTEGTLPPAYVVGLPPKVVLLFSIPGLVAYLTVRQRRQHAELEAAHARLRRQAMVVEQLAVSRERNRLSRELHDTLAHSLSGLSVQLQAVGKLFERKPEAAREILNSAQQTARSGLAEARRAIAALRASPLEELGLVKALEERVGSLGERTGVEARCVIEGDFHTLGPALEQTLYRIAEEALMNVERHAAARRAEVDLVREGQSITLTVRDDGVGFDESWVGTGEHFGLAGMRERAELVGGYLEATSSVGAGTTIVFTVEE